MTFRPPRHWKDDFIKTKNVYDITMKNKKEVAKQIYDKLKKEDVKSTLSLISKELEKEKTDKLGFSPKPLCSTQ